MIDGCIHLLIRLVCFADLQSVEDQKLKESLELLVTRIMEVKADGKLASAASDPNAPVFKDSKEAYAHAVGVQKLALEALRKEIRTSTTSMTSIPKPLKFLRPHYEPLKAYWESMPSGDNKVWGRPLARCCVDGCVGS